MNGVQQAARHTALLNLKAEFRSELEMLAEALDAEVKAREQQLRDDAEVAYAKLRQEAEGNLRVLLDSITEQGKKHREALNEREDYILNKQEREVGHVLDLLINFRSMTFGRRLRWLFLGRV